MEPAVSQDGAWQKRGSMKSYNSLSGNSFDHMWQ